MVNIQLPRWHSGNAALQPGTSTYLPVLNTRLSLSAFDVDYASPRDHSLSPRESVLVGTVEQILAKSSEYFRPWLEKSLPVQEHALRKTTFTIGGLLFSVDIISCCNG